MSIRPYEPADYAGCIRAFESNQPAFFADHEKEEFETLLEEIAAPGGSTVYYYVVEHEGVIAACAGFCMQPDKASAGLVWGMVARDFHRQGIGKQLLTYRLNKIRELLPGVPVILDTTQLSYPFFEKSGFRVTRITRDYYAPGLDRYDMILEPAGISAPA
ncbi:GNAT family N-acetyltransferase [Dyadobacter sp. 676]|uniref:GNAT family N-acetyltransferase n=1 Tax=Dyadobacter sp. 676 TaxID=3088362 RepID=A0AAU8FN80_9BACT